MRKLFSFSKKFALVFAVLAIGLVAAPASGALAAGLSSGSTPPANDSLAMVAWIKCGRELKEFTIDRDFCFP